MIVFAGRNPHIVSRYAVILSFFVRKAISFYNI